MSFEKQVWLLQVACMSYCIGIWTKLLTFFRDIYQWTSWKEKYYIVNHIWLMPIHKSPINKKLSFVQVMTFILIRWQAITWSNDDPVQWCSYHITRFQWVKWTSNTGSQQGQIFMIYTEMISLQLQSYLFSQTTPITEDICRDGMMPSNKDSEHRNLAGGGGGGGGGTFVFKVRNIWLQLPGCCEPYTVLRAANQQRTPVSSMKIWCLINSEIFFFKNLHFSYD